MSDTALKAQTGEIDPRVALFTELEHEFGDPKWVGPLRKAGISRFAEKGFPTLKDEDWRFTNIKPIVALPFQPMIREEELPPSDFTLADQSFATIDGSKLVFIDGLYSPSLSRIQSSEGVTIGSLKGALSEGSEWLKSSLDGVAADHGDVFADLNCAFFRDGAFINVAAGTSLEAPITLIFVSSGRKEGTAIHPRNLIAIGRGAKATVIESYVGIRDAATFTNTVTEFYVAENADFEHIKLQDESDRAFHIGGMHARLERDCRFAFHSFALGGAICRNNIRTNLEGEGLECILNGLYLTEGRQVSDHHMVVNHAKPNCESHEYFNGILDDESRGVFHGRILVQRIAQKTDAKQTNKNLLLSDNAVADTKPQLEIYADDVKCTHGATIGQLDKNAIFYLRARGLPLDVARQMLMHAFAGEIVDRIWCISAREEIDRMVWDRLEANPHVAPNATPLPHD